jgi:hypothetical protein
MKRYDDRAQELLRNLLALFHQGRLGFTERRVRLEEIEWNGEIGYLQVVFVSCWRDSLGPRGELNRPHVLAIASYLLDAQVVPVPQAYGFRIYDVYLRRQRRQAQGEIAA